MAKVVGRLVRWAVVLTLIDAVLRLARQAKQRQRAEREPPVEPAWPPLKVEDAPAPAATIATTLVEPDEPPTPAAATATTLVERDEPPAPAAAEASWVEAIHGASPDGYPVKVKVRSGIFHLPGMLNYERTTPDRCYASAAAAEADGFRPAKR